MEQKKPPSPEVIARIDREWPALRKALGLIAAKNAPPQDAEDIVGEAYSSLKSGSRTWDPEANPDFAVFAGMVVLSTARNWRGEAWNRRRDRGGFDETRQRWVVSTRLGPEQTAILKQEFERAFYEAFRKDSLEDRLFELVKKGVSDPADQAEALGISTERVRALVGRINRVCNNLIEKNKET